MTVKHDAESHKIHIFAKYLAERAHKIAILETYGQDSSYDKAQLIRDYQTLRESLFKAGWI